tara:strand:- start:519 stop:965 length:447 start_codon:yes stop_codon:yes gene_type:complete
MSKRKIKMNEKQLREKKGYLKLMPEKSYKRDQLPAVVSNNIADYLKSGLLVQTRRGYYMRPAEAVEEPAWVEAAKEATQPEEPVVAEPSQTIWDEARLQTGQKAVNIVQIIDGLLSGELGLSGLNEIKTEAVGILHDLGLIQPAEEVA